MNDSEPAARWPPRRIPAVVVRGVLAAGIAGLFAASWLTAGPGNYHALQVANMPAKPGVIHVTLPTVVIVGQRERAEPVKVASSAALSADNTGTNPLDPVANRVNLKQ
jgi:hypothetical protein